MYCRYRDDDTDNNSKNKVYRLIMFTVQMPVTIMI